MFIHSCLVPGETHYFSSQCTPWLIYKNSFWVVQHFPLVNLHHPEKTRAQSCPFCFFFSKSATDLLHAASFYILRLITTFNGCLSMLINTFVIIDHNGDGSAIFSPGLQHRNPLARMSLTTFSHTATYSDFHSLCWSVLVLLFLSKCGFQCAFILWILLFGVALM